MQNKLSGVVRFTQQAISDLDRRRRVRCRDAMILREHFYGSLYAAHSPLPDQDACQG
ncbi:hypothetical protein AB7M49_004213 [Bradyrhizobium elkanii]|uniref:Uncharacterized protein n=1 Tax=Bradyrhizobium elkanii TaxID=29448 RepID=A0A8I2C951_BRAEL|nr:hypothetical protein [Bradyrhizobium elkanii]MBP1299829.1 hypothetical protein [Bradyrhizobium elkanii]